MKIDRSRLNNLPNDDADYQIAWFELVKRKGLGLTSFDLAIFARDNIWYPFGEYGYSMRNIRMGIYPPTSGNFNNDYWHCGMGCPIRSEIWAYLFPLSPSKAAEYAVMDGQVDHGEISIWAEAFLSAMQSACFTAGVLEDAIEIGLQCIPNDSAIYSTIRSVLKWTDAGLETLRIREMIISNYGHPDFTHALQNVAFALLALLRGENDIWKSMEIALNLGYDSDCTCATAGATLGILGCSRSIDEATLALLPEDFVLGVDIPVESTKITKLADDVADFAIAHGALAGPLDRPNSPELGIRSGALVQYKPKPVVSPLEWTGIEVIHPGFADGYLVAIEESLELKTTPDGYAVKVKAECREVKDHCNLRVECNGARREFGVATAMKWSLPRPIFRYGPEEGTRPLQSAQRGNGTYSWDHRVI